MKKFKFRSAFDFDDKKLFDGIISCNLWVLIFYILSFFRNGNKAESVGWYGNEDGSKSDGLKADSFG